MVKTGQKIVKYGLYDRPELESWFKGRIVLLGDAAHPTSPHLAQGANQAFEDIYHFVRLLGKHNPSADQLSKELLLRVFTDYQDLRLLRTSELVRGARRQGEIRVVEGVDACRARDEAIRAGLNDDAARRAHDELLSGPFTVNEIRQIQNYHNIEINTNRNWWFQLNLPGSGFQLVVLINRLNVCCKVILAILFSLLATRVD